MIHENKDIEIESDHSEMIEIIDTDIFPKKSNQSESYSGNLFRSCAGFLGHYCTPLRVGGLVLASYLINLGDAIVLGGLGIIISDTFMKEANPFPESSADWITAVSCGAVINLPITSLVLINTLKGFSFCEDVTNFEFYSKSAWFLLLPGLVTGLGAEALDYLHSDMERAFAYLAPELSVAALSVGAAAGTSLYLLWKKSNKSCLEIAKEIDSIENKKEDKQEDKNNFCNYNR